MADRVVPKALVLWHGAGGNREHRHFLALEDALDIPVVRLNFAYREKGPRQPPARANRLVEEVVETIPAVAADLGVDPSEMVLGGRSMGGRIASMAVAAGQPAAGLALLSYPLHPPGKPEKLRVEHFPDLSCPVLFVSGDRDPFGKPAEWPAHLGTIEGEVAMEWLEGDAHDPKKNDAQLVEAVVAWITDLAEPDRQG